MAWVTRTGLGWLSLLLGLASLALLAAAVYGYRFAGWPWPQTFGVATYAVWAGVAGLAAGALALIPWARGRERGLVVILLGLVLSLPLAGLGAVFDISARLTPPINDVSTDTADPPVFWFTATPSEYPAANATPQRAAYPEVRPLELALQYDAVFDAALALVRARGWRILSDDRADTQIEAIATSPVFGFEDEVAIRLTAEGAMTRIDMRSRSRLGRIDRGANARRITAFLSDLAVQARD